LSMPADIDLIVSKRMMNKIIMQPVVASGRMFREIIALSLQKGADSV